MVALPDMPTIYIDLSSDRMHIKDKPDIFRFIDVIASMINQSALFKVESCMCA